MVALAGMTILLIVSGFTAPAGAGAPVRQGTGVDLRITIFVISNR